MPADDPLASLTWRNLGIAAYNVLHDAARARECYDAAVAAAPDDARLWYERDQLAKRLGEAPEHRLAVLAARPDLVASRDDLTLEVVGLELTLGNLDEASRRLTERRFQPWEGGEGLVVGTHARTHRLLARQALEAGDAPGAVEHLREALRSPEHLGEARHPLANAADLYLALGDARAATGDEGGAREAWTVATSFTGDFQEMSVRPYSEMTYWSALACQRLGEAEQAADLLVGLQRYAEELRTAPATVEYFATSLPAMLLFDEDLQTRQETTALLLLAQAQLGLGHRDEGAKTLAEVLTRDPSLAAARDLVGSAVPAG
jgi:tetratricopeptide (TPR) repeat protein